MAELKKILQMAGLAFGVVAVAYNFLMMLNSTEGLFMHQQLNAQLQTEKAELAELQDQYAFLTRRADSLLTAGLDEDLLEERVRGVLGLVRPDEYLVRMEDLDRLAVAYTDEAPTRDNTSEPLRYAGLPTEILR